MYYFYILKSQKNSSYYIGSCGSLDQRLRLHNAGLVKSTKRYMPWLIAYFEQYRDLKSARHREQQVKSWKKRSVIERLISKF